MINTTRNLTFNNRIDRNRYASQIVIGSSGRGAWTHDPNHRRGIAYRTPGLDRQFNRGPLPGADARRSFRGYDRGATGGAFVQRANRSEIQPLPRGTTGPKVVRPEPSRQLPVPTQQPRATPGQRVARPEPPRPPSAPVQPPRLTTSPAPARPQVHRPFPVSGNQGLQGLQGPTAFGGLSQSGQTRQSSNRGHESLSKPRGGGPEPGGIRTSPGGGHPGGGPGRERGR